MRISIITIIGSIFILTSCYRKHEAVMSINDDEPSKLKLPIGNYKAIKYNFPSSWSSISIEEIDTTKTSTDSEILQLTDYAYKFQQSLVLNKEIFKVFLPSNAVFSTTPSEHVKIDTLSYFAGYILKEKNYSLAIFKDRGIYDWQLGNEGCVINYLTLATLNKEMAVIDALTISINVQCLIGSSNRYFYIDKKLNILVKDYNFEEEHSYFLAEKRYRISGNGKFIELKP